MNSVETNNRIWQMISSRPMTRNELSKRLGVSDKTIRNGLGEIHWEFEHPKTKRAQGKVFAVFETPNTRRYGISSKQSRVRLGNSTYALTGRNRLRSDGYSTAIYEPVV